MEGYIIVNLHWAPSVQMEMGGHTFGKSAAHAWRRHIGPPENSSIDFSVIVQRWSDKGYGPRKVTMSFAPPE